MALERVSFDVVVVGGGPAGACTAGLLAADGRRVLVLEQDKFPRFHIGESLITAVWPTLDRLGLRERLDRLFVRKYGANVLWGSDAEFWGFMFRDGGPFEYVHQVRRGRSSMRCCSAARANSEFVSSKKPRSRTWCAKAKSHRGPLSAPRRG